MPQATTEWWNLSRKKIIIILLWGWNLYIHTQHIQYIIVISILYLSHNHTEFTDIINAYKLWYITITYILTKYTNIIEPYHVSFCRTIVQRQYTTYKVQSCRTTNWINKKYKRCKIHKCERSVFSSHKKKRSSNADNLENHV